MSPNGTYLAVLTSPKKNECDIHDVKSEYVEKISNIKNDKIKNSLLKLDKVFKKK